MSYEPAYLPIKNSLLPQAADELNRLCHTTLFNFEKFKGKHDLEKMKSYRQGGYFTKLVMGVIYPNIEQQNQYEFSEAIDKVLKAFVEKERRFKVMIDNPNLGCPNERLEKATNQLFELQIGHQPHISTLNELMDFAISSTNTLFANPFNQKIKALQPSIQDFWQEFQQYNAAWRANKAIENNPIIAFIKEALNLSDKKLKARVISFDEQGNQSPASAKKKEVIVPVADNATKIQENNFSEKIYFNAMHKRCDVVDEGINELFKDSQEQNTRLNKLEENSQEQNTRLDRIKKGSDEMQNEIEELRVNSHENNKVIEELMKKAKTREQKEISKIEESPSHCRLERIR